MADPVQAEEEAENNGRAEREEQRQIVMIALLEIGAAADGDDRPNREEKITSMTPAKLRQ